VNSSISFIATRHSNITLNLVKSASILARWFNWRGVWESERCRTHNIAMAVRQDCQSGEAVKHISALRQ